MNVLVPSAVQLRLCEQPLFAFLPREVCDQLEALALDTLDRVDGASVEAAALVAVRRHPVTVALSAEWTFAAARVIAGLYAGS